MEYEIYHAGVKGMRWGVRNDKKSGSTNRSSNTKNTTSTKVKQRGNTTTISARDGKQKAKLTVKRDRGAKLVAKHDKTRVKVIVSNTTAVAAGAMRVAAAFIPGMSVLNGVATAATLVGTVANVTK